MGFWKTILGTRYKCLLFFVLLVELRTSQSLQLNCRYRYYPDVGQTCEIFNATITDNDHGESFEFSKNKLENRKVKTLLFRKVAPSFVPKETFEAFPQLDGIGVYYSNVKLIDVNFMENYLRYAYDLNTFYLGYNKIEMIEPKVLAIFKRFRNVRLEGNVCIKESFRLNNCNLNDMRTKLSACFNNYFTNFPEKNTTDQIDILQTDNIPEFLITSSQTQIDTNLFMISVLIIHSLIKFII